MKRTAILSFISILLIAGGVSAAPQDPSGGACDELETSSNLYPVCLQAYSAKNRLYLLATTNASQNAIDNAQAALDAAIDEYKALTDGGLVQGFCPCDFSLLALAEVGIQGEIIEDYEREECAEVSPLNPDGTGNITIRANNLGQNEAETFFIPSPSLQYCVLHDPFTNTDG